MDDVLDSGLTTASLYDRLNPVARSMSVACLLRKPNAVTLTRAWRRLYFGHDISSEFVYGYGMDRDGKERQRDAVYVAHDG